MAAAFGRVLGRLLADRHLSQRQVASRFGCEPSTISRLCTGSRLPSLGMLAVVCDALELDRDDEINLILAAFETARQRHREEMETR